jgi:hypothetical protein
VSLLYWKCCVRMEIFMTHNMHVWMTIDLFQQVNCSIFFFIRAQSICPGCTAAYKVYCATLIPPWFRRSHFHRQAPPCPYDARDPSNEKWNLWARMLAGNFA